MGDHAEFHSGNFKRRQRTKTVILTHNGKALRRSWLLLQCASAALLHAQDVRAVYLYDDLGRLAKVVDRATGECAIYSYDAVGNILSIAREVNCAAPPALDSITLAGDNLFTVTGRNLLGATVTLNLPGLHVADMHASDTRLTFRLGGSEITCAASDVPAVVTTPLGSVATTLTLPGAAQLTLGRAATGVLAQAGQTNFYCLHLPVTLAAVVQVTADPGGGLVPCVAVFRNLAVPPAPDDTACGTVGDPVALADTLLTAGQYYVAVSGTGFTAGSYTLIVKQHTVWTYQPAVEAVFAGSLPLDGWGVTPAWPAVEAILPGTTGTAPLPVTFARPVVEAVWPGPDATIPLSITLAQPPVAIDYDAAAGPAALPPDDQTSSQPQPASGPEPQ